MSDSLFRKDTSSDTYFINATSIDELLEIASIHGFSQDDKTKIKSLLTNNLMSEEEIKKIFVDNCDFMVKPMEIFNETQISHFLLSSVGIAIGYANLKQKLGYFSDLSIWIK